MTIKRGKRCCKSIYTSKINYNCRSSLTLRLETQSSSRSFHQRGRTIRNILPQIQWARNESWSATAVRPLPLLSPSRFASPPTHPFSFNINSRHRRRLRLPQHHRQHPRQPNRHIPRHLRRNDRPLTPPRPLLPPQHKSNLFRPRAHPRILPFPDRPSA